MERVSIFYSVHFYFVYCETGKENIVSKHSSSFSIIFHYSHDRTYYFSRRLASSSTYDEGKKKVCFPSCLIFNHMLKKHLTRLLFSSIASAFLHSKNVSTQFHKEFEVVCSIISRFQHIFELIKSLLLT